MPGRPRRAWQTVAATLAAGFVLAGCGSAPRGPGGAGGAADIAALQQVVQAFQTAIIDKDKARFLGLFFSDRPEQVTWQAVVDDASLATIQKTRPQAIKARYRPDNHVVAFIDGVVASPVREEETFSDVRIDTDGEVASVSFDYVYRSDGKASNSGREKWLLVRTEQGWKITAVVYTIRLPQPGAAP